MQRPNRIAVMTLALALAVGWTLVARSAFGQAGRGGGGANSTPSAKADRVNLNTATQQQLEDLPGVGAATAKKIIAGRPYKTIDDLSKAGISQSEISKLTPLVTVSTSSRSGGGGDSATPAAKPKADKPARVDLNTASQSELEELPGVGPATARKIIAARPYKTVDELAKAGVSKAEIEKLTSQVTVGKPAAAAGATDTAAVKNQPPVGTKVDLNSASESDLEQLPGVGPATAKKIVAARPYKSVDDLSKAGVSKAEIAKLTPLVRVGSMAGPRGSAATAAPQQQGAAKQAPANASPAGGTTAKVNLNAATQAELEALPGVGPVTAKKIIAARPIKSIDDLEKAGVSKAEVVKLTPLVTAGPETTGPDDATPARVPPKPGMVWVNTDSKIFHRAGDRWYGKTKQGQFMTEQDAIKQGYRESKETPGAKSTDANSGKGK